MVDASYAKIRDMTLSYTFQPRLLKMAKIQTLTIFTQATNFMIWRANHYGIDPEYINPITGTRSVMPYDHSYTIGLNLTF